MKVRHVIIVQNFPLDEYSSLVFFSPSHENQGKRDLHPNNCTRTLKTAFGGFVTPRTSLHHFHFPFLLLGPRSCIRQTQKKLCRLALRCCGEDRGRSLAFVTAEISLSGAEVFNYGISVVSGFKAAFSLLLFCTTSRLFFCIYDPIGPCVCAWL